MRGPEGNIEYLMYLKKDADGDGGFDKDMISAIVSRAHESL